MVSDIQCFNSNGGAGSLGGSSLHVSVEGGLGRSRIESPRAALLLAVEEVVDVPHGRAIEVCELDADFAPAVFRWAIVDGAGFGPDHLALDGDQDLQTSTHGDVLVTDEGTAAEGDRLRVRQLFQAPVFNVAHQH